MAVMMQTSPQRILGDAPSAPMVVKQLLPQGTTALEVGRAEALQVETARYESATAYLAESKLRTDVMAEAAAASIARNDEYLAKLAASKAEAEVQAARNKAQDLAYYHAATETRRWPVSPVSTGFGIRQAPY
eukprot:Rhum_TRINITY_DN16426_c0_g1::Rhum_TRINITY_DN16426_c0_g1_i1::g.163152::m.163152